MKKNKRIFIHIPKTGGTTLICAINGTNWQTKPDFNYRHIIYETKLSNSGDIFHSKNFEKYQDYEIFTILRHPVDRLISEYYFIRDRKEFMSLFKRKPRNLIEYAQNKQTQNYMSSFLLGHRMYDPRIVKKEDLLRIINAIDNLPILVGIFEEYPKSMKYLAKHMKIKWPKNIEVKRVTLNRPELSEVDDESKQIIEDCNKFDMELYNHCLQRLNDSNVNSTSVNFKKDKYSYVMKYTERFILFELYEVDNTFLTRNSQYFTNLNIVLHEHLNTKDGISYVLSWNKNVLNALKIIEPGFGRFDSLINQYKDDPLEFTKLLAKNTKSKILNNRKFKNSHMKFDINSVEIIKEEKVKNSFLSRLLGR